MIGLQKAKREQCLSGIMVWNSPMLIEEKNQIEFNKRYTDKFGKLKIQFSHGNKTHRETALLLVKKVFPDLEGKKILEVGGGVTNLLTRFPNTRLVGFDISEQAVREMKLEAQGKNLGGVFTQKFEEVEAEGPFDLIILSHILEHIEDPVTFLQKYLKLLNPSGFFVILVPANEPRSDYHKRHQTGFYFDLHHQHFSDNSLKEVVGKAGLKVIWQIKNNSAQHLLDQLVRFSFLRQFANLCFFLLPFRLHLWTDKLLATKFHRQLGVVCQVKFNRVG